MALVNQRLNETGLQGAAIRRLSAGNVASQDQTDRATDNPFSTANATLPTETAPPVPKVDPNQALKDFSFNSRYAAQDQTLRRNVVSAGEDRTNNLARTEQDYKATVQDAERAQKTAAQRLAERLASQGIYQSGINVEETGNLANDYQRYLNGVTTRRANNITDIERGYGRTIGDVAAQREALYGQQVAEEEAIRLDNERQAAAAEAARQEAARQRELQAQIAQQQAAALQAAAASRVSVSPVSIPTIGAPGVDLPSFDSANPQDQQRILDYINSQTDLGWLHRMNDLNNPIVEIPGANVAPAMPTNLAEAVKRRIQTINDANKAQQKATGDYTKGGFY